MEIVTKKATRIEGRDVIAIEMTGENYPPLSVVFPMKYYFLSLIDKNSGNPIQYTVDSQEGFSKSTLLLCLTMIVIPQLLMIL